MSPELDEVTCGFEEALEKLKRDPSSPVRARVDELEVEIRAVGGGRELRLLGDALAALGPWDGETAENLTARLREVRR